MEFLPETFQYAISKEVGSNSEEIDIAESIIAIDDECKEKISRKVLKYLKKISANDLRNYMSILSYACVIRPQNRRLIYPFIEYVYKRNSKLFKTFPLLLDISRAGGCAPKDQLLDPYAISLYKSDSLEFMILHDNVSMLKRKFPILKKKNEDITINSSYFYDVFTKGNACTPVELSALCGSGEAFKFFVLNEEKLTDMIPQYTVAGGNFEIVDILSQSESQFYDCLDVAVAYHRFELFEWLNENFSYDECPLDKCLEYMNQPVFLLYAFNGADLNFTNAYGNTCLHFALAEGDFTVAKYLINKKMGINSQEYEFDQTPLFIAAKRENTTAVDLLLEKGVDVNVCDTDGKNALFYALECPAIFRRLVAQGIDTSKKDKEGKCVIHYAAIEGNVECMKILVESKADIKVATDYFGFHAIHCAAMNGNREIVGLLLNNGEDIDARDSYGKTPLMWAAGNGHLDIVKFIVEKGDDVSTTDELGNTPLHWAATNGQIKVIEYLLSKGANIEARDKSGRTPFHSAAINGQVKAVEMFINKGADQAIDNNGRTPLVYAVNNSHYDIVRLLDTEDDVD